jgi:hypothetical protein
VRFSFFDGLDALIESLTPAAKEYPIAPLALFVLPALVVILLLIFGRRKLKR